MSALAIVGTTIGGAGLGFIAGAWYGTATDTSDFPIGVLLGLPGALVGGLAGCVLGAVVFA